MSSMGAVPEQEWSRLVIEFQPVANNPPNLGCSYA
jgi:hypothetical protein